MNSFDRVAVVAIALMYLCFIPLFVWAAEDYFVKNSPVIEPSKNSVFEAVEPVESTIEKDVLVVEEIDIQPATDVVEVVEDEIEEEVVYEQLWTEEDAIALAKMVWGEARGVKSLRTSGGLDVSGDAQRAATVWTALNRFDAGYADSIYKVVVAKDQFHGYKKSYPVDDDILELVYDVLDRWNRDKHGCEDVGRVLPAGYLWFSSYKVDGKSYNRFRNEYRSNNYWDWSLEDVYG